MSKFISAAAYLFMLPFKQVFLMYFKITYVLITVGIVTVHYSKRLEYALMCVEFYLATRSNFIVFLPACIS